LEYARDLDAAMLQRANANIEEVHLAIIGNPVVQWYNNNALLHHGLIPRLMVMTKTRLVVFIIDLIIFSVVFMATVFVVKRRIFFSSSRRVFFLSDLGF